MKDILKDFLEEGEILFESMPVDFFPDPSGTKNSDGILPVLYAKWAYSRGLMSFDNDELRKSLSKNGNFQEKLKVVRKILGNELLPSHFTREGFIFTRKYYNPGWKHLYFTDFGSAFPNYESFEDIPDTQENYHLIESFLDQRFNEWRSEEPEGKKL
ncbi:hypothetical protein [Pseudomonas aeruginosa]|uniref:hypothetical protein n=1 Tax=Pseudomonas aeruginosa TaxID=287 RepID=UPI00070FBD21|nr:hypothetical protein [Pseudomonas aeruginosa]NNB80033.1 hypothetical protein [Pseudomonas aeruginosa]RUB40440.1 hypothetical protein IPC1432_00235 [Pseudomonas aeruginosa]HCD6632546.1 hypothetical protein [Pseudomonas aeruginosa]HCD7568819.1 hypothetical protein [Pseudomonas aeruginosa]HCZ9129349.1 hypothetical protein [Pseudomonas aeruginosa]